MLTAAEWSIAAAALHLSGRALQTVREVFDNRTQLALAGDRDVSRHTANTRLERCFERLRIEFAPDLTVLVGDKAMGSGPYC